MVESLTWERWDPCHYWEWIRAVVDPQARIVDLGCGDLNTWQRGYQGRHDRVPPDLPTYPHLTAVDYDGIDPGDFPCTFVQADILHLPFPADAFDVAVVSQVLEHVPDPTAALVEALRVAPQVVVTVPLGHAYDLETQGDACARLNPWIRYREFIPDTVFPHHAHVRVFDTPADLLAIVPPTAAVVRVGEGRCDGGAWAGAILGRQEGSTPCTSS
jgi:SAM-dependent methyltransferase